MKVTITYKNGQAEDFENMQPPIMFYPGFICLGRRGEIKSDHIEFEGFTWLRTDDVLRIETHRDTEDDAVMNLQNQVWKDQIDNEQN